MDCYKWQRQRCTDVASCLLVVPPAAPKLEGGEGIMQLFYFTSFQARLPIPQLGFVNLAHMGTALHYIHVMST